MSIHDPQLNQFLPGDTRRPIVLRFAEMFPSALAHYEMHAARRGGTLDHIDPERSGDNRLLIGKPDWRQNLEEEISAAAALNRAQELEALVRRKRAKEIQDRLNMGNQMPWRASAGGPLREVILTAHRDWFAETDTDAPETRAQRFEAQAVAWLRSRFADAVVHARADHDEMTYHIHAILAPWVEKTSARRGTQRLLQPSSHPLLKNYEAAQDDVGEYFAEIGLQRGKRRAEQRRKIAERIAERQRRRAELAARGKDVPADLLADQDPALPDPVRHKPTPVWWAEEKERLDRERAQVAAARKQASVVAQQQAQKAVALDRRETAVAGREAEAQELVTTVEVIAASPDLPPIKPSSAVGTLTKRFLVALRDIRLQLEGRALEVELQMAQARAEIAEERKALKSLRATVEAYQEKVLKSLPAFARRAWAAITGPDKAAVEDAEKAAKDAGEKRVRKDRGDDR